MLRMKIRSAITMAVLFGPLLLMTSVDATAGDNKRISKQISIMEKILDEALVESRFALVRSTHPTHGVYIEDYGPVFTLEVGLVDSEGWFGGSIWSNLGKDFSIITEEDEDGEKVITIRSGSKKGKKADNEDVMGDEEKYGKVKDEIIEVMRDYGDTIAKAKPNEWFTVFASPLHTSWGDDGYHRLVLRVQMKEISAFTSGKLSEDKFAQKVQITEY